MTRKQITSLLLLAASIAYDLMPADLIPDIPFIGWLDDFFITSSAALNCLQQFNIGADRKVETVLKWLKWGCVLVGVLIIIVVLLLAGTVASMMGK